MTKLMGKTVADLRVAAKAWCDHDAKINRMAFWFMSKIDMSVHDRIDELIDEIQRLRAIKRARKQEAIHAE